LPLRSGRGDTHESLISHRHPACHSRARHIPD
jgi:hypothetical protein